MLRTVRATVNNTKGALFFLFVELFGEGPALLYAWPFFLAFPAQPSSFSLGQVSTAMQRTALSDRQTDGHSLEEQQHTQMRPEAIRWLKPCTAKIADQGHMSFSCTCLGSEMNQYQFETNRSPSEISLGKGPRMSALKCTYSMDGHSLRGPRSALQLTVTLIIINWARLFSINNSKFRYGAR